MLLVHLPTHLQGDFQACCDRMEGRGARAGRGHQHSAQVGRGVAIDGASQLLTAFPML
jgi:hypothetical protein